MLVATVPRILPDDTARTRRTDPISSHIAADVSRRTLKQTKRAVLQIVLQEGSLVGSEINELYLLRAARSGWAHIAYDTPRKRAGELADDGFLEVAQYRTARGNNLPEAEYRITDAGKTAVTA